MTSVVGRHLRRTPARVRATDDGGQQTTPIVVDGVIYLDTPGGDVIAVDGATGASQVEVAADVAIPRFGDDGTRRGVSVGDGKVYTLAGGNRVVALDKDTGARSGWCSPPAPDGAILGNIAKVATVYHDGMVYVGDQRRQPQRGVRRCTRATARIVWSFYGGPMPGTSSPTSTATPSTPARPGARCCRTA